MKHIDLGDGLTATVDDEDYDRINAHRWRPLKAGRGFYAYRNGGGKTTLMHREIMNSQPGERVDHRDRDGLNNVRGNLRSATPMQNSRNKSKKVGANCPFKGVYFDATNRNAGKPFRAQIVVVGVKHRLGRFAVAEDAARAYDAAAARFHGDFAATNVTLGLLPPL